MTRNLVVTLAILVPLAAAVTTRTVEQGAGTASPDMNAFFQVGPDATERPGVPKGEVRGPFVLPSQAYLGTQHTYWLYVHPISPSRTQQSGAIAGAIDRLNTTASTIAMRA